MRTRDARVRRIAGWLGALGVAAALAAAVPGTSSAFTASITNSADTASSKAVFSCADVFSGDPRRSTAYFEYALREDAGATTAVDSGPGGNSGSYEGSNAKDTASPRACPADRGTPYLLDGSSRVITSSATRSIRQDFSIEIWFKTSSTAAEKIMGFESSQSGSSDHYDKQLYLDGSGYLHYGIYDGNTNTNLSPTAVNDGVWHQAVATTSSTSGSTLYIDGAPVSNDPNKTVAEDYDGYWRIGQGRTDSWPGMPSYSSFTGSLSFAGAYATVLTAAEVRSAYQIGKPAAAADTTKTARPSPTPTATPTAAPDATASAAPAATGTPAPVDSATLSATPGSGSVKSGTAPTYAPAPTASDTSAAAPTS